MMAPLLTLSQLTVAGSLRRSRPAAAGGQSAGVPRGPGHEVGFDAGTRSGPGPTAGILRPGQMNYSWHSFCMDQVHTSGTPA